MTIPEKAPRMQNTKPSLGAVMTGVIVLLIYAAVFVLEQIIPPTSMLFTVLKKGATYALVAVSMNLLNGFTGLFSLGQAGFMLIGAYTYAISDHSGRKPEPWCISTLTAALIQFALPVIPALILAGLMAAAFAFLIGLPVLRLKSDYLAIATLGFAEIIRAIFQWDKLGAVTNGSNMLRLFPTFNDFNIRNAEGEVTLYLSTTIPFLIAGVCIGLIVLLLHSSYGRAFMAIRDDEIAAEAMGVNLARHKRLAFCISSFFAGVGGAMLAMYSELRTGQELHLGHDLRDSADRGHRRHRFRHRQLPEFVPVRGLLRMVAALPGSEADDRHMGGASAAQRLPSGGFLHYYHDRGAVLPAGHYGHPGTPEISSANKAARKGGAVK